jgi:Tfp pilus assembly protein PilE
MPKNKGEFGFIELMIAVIIIVILAALATPRFVALTTRAKQSEAKEILQQIYDGERAHHQEYGTYWGNGISADASHSTNFNSIGVEIPKTARYKYSIEATWNIFTATATV